MARIFAIQWMFLTVSWAVWGFLPQPANAAPGEAPLVGVTTVLRSNEVIETLELTGTVNSKQHARLSARTDGLIKTVNVDAGDQVEAGETLLQMDSQLAQIDLEIAAAELERAQIQRDDAVRRFREAKKLIDDGAFAKSQAGTLEAEVATSEAELKLLQAREKRAREQITRHQLVAPFSGTIARKATEAGEWVDTGTMVFELVETQSLWFDLQVAQEYIGAIRSVEKATLMLDSFPGRVLEAEVDVVVPVKDPVSRTFLTRLTFENDAKDVAPGMSGTATLSYRPGGATVAIVPRDAVLRSTQGATTVWVAEVPDGAESSQTNASVRSVKILTAGNLGESVRVLEGLKGGERVVVRGNEGLTEGQAVVVREFVGSKDDQLK